MGKGASRAVPTSCVEWWGTRSVRAHSRASTALPTLRKHASPFSPRNRARAMPEIFRPLKTQRARGMPGAQCTRSLVCAGGVKYAHQYSQRRHRKHPAFPTQWFYGLYVISPVTSSFLPPSSHGLNGFTCPVGSPKPPRDLASATDARTTRLRRPLQRRSSCALDLNRSRACTRPAISSRRRCRVHRIPPHVS